MEDKAWYKSKTMIVNIFTIIALIVEHYYNLTGLDPGFQAPLLALVNIGLRLFTTAPIKGTLESVKAGGSTAAMIITLAALGMSMTACSGSVGVQYDGKEWRTQMQGYIDWQEAIALAANNKALAAQAPGVAQAMRILVSEKANE